MTPSRNLDVDISYPLPVRGFLPDETLFSACSRTHRVSCQALSRATCMALFGHPRNGSQHDFPGRVGEFVERTGGAFGISASDLITEHTVFRFYMAWCSEQATNAAINSMTGSGGIGALKMNLGLPSSRLRANHPLKFCPICLSQDKKMHGAGYWHLAHQYPGVWICLAHDCGLVESNIKATGVGRFDWHLPTLREAYPSFDVPTLRSTVKSQLRTLASLIAGVTSLQAGIHLDHQKIHHSYRQALRALGWISPSGRVLIRDICSRHEETIGILQIVSEPGGTPRSRVATETEVRRLLHAPRCDTHPLRHLLFIQTLFGQWDSFWRMYQDAGAMGPDLIVDGVRQRGAPGTDAQVTKVMRSQLVSLMRDKGWSASRAADEVGVSRQTAIAWATKAGMRTSKRPQQARDARGKMIADLRRGCDKLAVANKFGVTVQTITRLLVSEVGLQTGWHAARHDRNRKRARKLWLAAKRKNPSLGVKGVRLLEPGTYAWLYRNDRHWLELHKNADSPVLLPPKRLVDWVKRDARLSNLTLQAILEARERGGEKRVTLQQVYQKLPELKAKLGRLELLPQTQRVLQAVRRRGREAQDGQFNLEL